MNYVFWIIITIIQFPFLILGGIAYFIFKSIDEGWNAASEMDIKDYNNNK